MRRASDAHLSQVGESAAAKRLKENPGRNPRPNAPVPSPHGGLGVASDADPTDRPTTGDPGRCICFSPHPPIHLSGPELVRLACRSATGQTIAKARGGPERERPEGASASPARSRNVEVGGEMEVYWPARTGREGRKRRRAVRCGRGGGGGRGAATISCPCAKVSRVSKTTGRAKIGWST